MDLLMLLLVIAIIGVAAFYLSNLPMAAPFKIAIQLLAAVACFLIVLRALGVVLPDVLR